MRYGAGGPGQLCRVVVRAPQGARRCVATNGRTPRLQAGPLLQATALALLCQRCQAQDLGGGGNDSTAAVIGKWLAVVALVAVSGLLAGLILGYLSLDKMALEIVLQGGDAREAAAARKIIPLRKDGNLVLCTLVVGNVAVNSLLAIISAGLTSGVIGFLLSTVLITVFGEILPQAVCARNALKIGAAAAPIMHSLIIIFYVICKPMAMALDKCLGDEVGTIHSRTELKELLALHVRHGALDVETGHEIENLIHSKDVEVGSVMTPLERVFMLHVDTPLNYQTIYTIFRSKFSRVPVYNASYSDVCGLLLTKDLVLVDPDDAVPVHTFLQYCGRPVHIVDPGQNLVDLLHTFKEGKTHMAFVRSGSGSLPDEHEGGKMAGIVTVEDIIKAVIGDTVNEVGTLDFVSDHADGRSSDRSALRNDGTEPVRQRLLKAIAAEEGMSPELTAAVVTYLHASVEPLSGLTRRQVASIIAMSQVLVLKRSASPAAEAHGHLYRRGHISYVCTLVLSGRVSLSAGYDAFRSEAREWTVLAKDALCVPKGEYRPDFSACVASDVVRILRISVDAFAAVKLGRPTGSANMMRCVPL